MRKPNILIFMTDHQRADTVAPFRRARTPNVDRLAAGGVTFARAFSTAPHCCPARASFHSGLYPSGHGVWNNVLNAQRLSRGLAPGVRLWSEDLAEAGYRLAHSGKWHVSADEWPRQRGWHEELLVSSSPGESHGVGWDAYARRAREAEPGGRSEGEILRPGYWPYRAYGVAERHDHDEKAVELGVEAIRRLAAGRGPWVVYVGVNGPHDPYFAPRRFLDMYDIEDVPLPPSYADDMTGKPEIVRRLREDVWGQLSEREVREAVRHYLAYCSYLDDLFGRLLGALDASGQAVDTLVLYASDHGDYCGDHGLFAKGVPAYRGAYHVPAVLRWPAATARPGGTVDELVSLVDVAPTFLDAAGVAPRRRLAGASLLPFLGEEPPERWREHLVTQCNGVELYYSQRSVFTKRWKYVFNGFDRDELYDLASDPEEMRNLADDPAFAALKREMVLRLWASCRDEGDEGLLSAYITVGLAPWGPAEAFRGGAGGRAGEGA